MRPINHEPLYYTGRHYDLQNWDYTEDIPFYLHQVNKYGGPVLELACGTGRIMLPLAEHGIRITGLDISRSMLARAREKAKERGLDLDLIQADCRNFRLNKKFNLIFLPFNSMAHLLDLESVRACFSCVREHLTERGRFIIDIFSPDFDILTRDPSRYYPVARYRDPDGRGTVVITETNIYDAAAQINRIKWYYRIGERKFVEDLSLRIFYPQELNALLNCSGFIIESKFGDYDCAPFVSVSPKQLVICCSRESELQQ